MRTFRLQLLLFLATCVTTTLQGALMVVPREIGSFDLALGWAILHPGAGLPFSVPLLAILLVHEMGHYITARIHKVPASLPYFIPVPPGFGYGTLGAVIGMRPSRDRNQIVDIGAAGPLAGLCVAIPVVIYGLTRSEVGPLPPTGALEGNSILYLLLKRAVTGLWLPGGGLDVNLSQEALAGWFGLFVTMLNLIPIGQLDGGHVATAYFGGDRYERVSRFLHRAIPLWALANFAYVTLDEHLGSQAPLRLAIEAGVGVAVPPLVWFGMLFLLPRVDGRYHPPLDNDVPLTAGRRVLFALTAVIFLLIFMPWPFRSRPGP